MLFLSLVSMTLKKEVKGTELTLLDTKSTLKLLKKYKIKTCKTEVCNDIKEFDSTYTKVGFPLVVKLASMETLHKTDAGAVIVGISNILELADAKKKIRKIIKEKKVKNYEIIFQEMIDGIELFVGMKRNESFGPVVLFGNGGIYVELYKDVALRVAPITKKDVDEMIDEVQAKKLLDGFRGGPVVNKSKLADILINLSNLSLKEKDIAEIDFNPIMANKKGLFAVDFRILMKNN